MSENTLHTRIISDGKSAVALERKLLSIIVKGGPDKGKKASFTTERVIIGTHPSCDFVLTDPTISRQHTEIALAPGGYLVRDLDSTNGTYIDRLRVMECVIEDKTRFTLGDTELIVTPLDESVELKLGASERFGGLLGRSVAMRRVFDELERFAPTNLTVLLLGESGTGKELAAEALHKASPRARKPFIVVDCGSLPPNLIESELFGHVRGAFTGAEDAREGAFEAADGGTVFLDEIGEMPRDLQSRLLGVLERKSVTPVGSSKPRSVDVRVVAATNRDLRKGVNRGTFREDLFFRLAVGVIQLPPLRERPEDIPLYVESFLDDPRQIDAAAMEGLVRQSWPGNVRELRNMIERISTIGVEHSAMSSPAEAAAPKRQVTMDVDATVAFKVAKVLLIEKYTQPYLEDLMRIHGGNISRAARAAELDRSHLLRLLDRFQMRPGREGGATDD